jgi:hypothetical protein
MKRKTIIYVAIALIVAVAFLPESLGGVLGYYYVVSGSMEPLVPMGSLIIAHPPWLKPPRLGDVVVYKSDSLGLIAHRLVGFKGGQYIIKADAGGYIEEVWPGRVIGVAVLIIPLMGWVGIAASVIQALPFIIAILLLASLIPGSSSKILYPISAGLSMLPAILPLNPALAFPLLGPYSNYFYTALFLSGSISAYYADRRGYAPKWLTELVLALVAVASVAVVRFPWLG